MSVLSDINSQLFGGNKETPKSLLNEQQQGVLSQIEGSAGTYRDLAQNTQSLYNPDWQNLQNQQVMQPMQQRMDDNVRELKSNNRKFGRASSSIAKRLNESASLRMNEMRMQQGVIENQRRVAMQEEARNRALGFEQMANQQDATVLNRRAKENIIEQTGGLLTPVIQGAQAGISGANVIEQYRGLGGNDSSERSSAEDVSSGGTSGLFQ